MRANSTPVDGNHHRRSCTGERAALGGSVECNGGLSCTFGHYSVGAGPYGGRQSCPSANHCLLSRITASPQETGPRGSSKLMKVHGQALVTHSRTPTLNHL